ncbi:MAG: YggS family pyridoxal phosphate-dependent enzyme [Bacteroidota bacterium]|nr:YggS family pyridoxal phosphate-dependent enzyme [Bacteroidota bacterium]
MEIQKNFMSFRSEIELIAQKCGRLTDTIKIVGVTKNQPIEHIIAAVLTGLQDIGENYVQELRAKYQVLSHLEIRWHFIGRIQTNKIKYLVPIVYMVHSVDRESVAIELNRQAEKYNRVLDILLQVNTSGEQTKAGVLPDLVPNLLSTVLSLRHLRPRGLMTLAGLEHSPEQVRAEFRLLRILRDELAHRFGLEYFTELSMGMSNDYPIAIEEGATILRIGTRIFGERPSPKTS